MHSSLALFVTVLALAACQVAPDKTVLVEEPRERCDTVYTGSRIPRCNRGEVKIMKREEVERAGVLSNPAAATGELLPGKSH